MLYTHKKTINQYKNQKLKAIHQVKNNQKTLLKTLQTASNLKIPIETDIQQDTKFKRNRKETRQAQLYYTKLQEWHAKSFIKLTRTVVKKVPKTQILTETQEISYYILTGRYTAKKANELIRKHWSIENKNHYVRDVTFKEDASRIKKCSLTMAIFRSFAINLIRLIKIDNMSLEIKKNAFSVMGMIKRYEK
jgi:predicted transposase YbfD/YdcC